MKAYTVVYETSFGRKAVTYQTTNKVSAYKLFRLEYGTRVVVYIHKGNNHKAAFHYAANER